MHHQAVTVDIAATSPRSEDAARAPNLDGEAIKGLRFGPFNTARLLLSGGIAGAVSKTCTAPLARLTILFQIQGMHGVQNAALQRGVTAEVLRILREEGVGALWKGNGVTIIHRLPYSAINFFSYERYKRWICQGFNKDKPEPIHRLLAGGGAGITAATMAYPLDLVRTRLAAQTTEKYYKGIWHALRTIAADEGLKGLYKGLGPTLMGVGPNLAINFCVYESTKAYWLTHKPEAPTVAVSLTCGSLAGITSSSVTFPIDLVRRRMQLEGQAGRSRVYQGGALHTLAYILKTEGLKGLYRGILPEYSKVVPGVGIAFMTYELMKQLLEVEGPH
eukprot:jgi/Chlat1/4194/Chrsp27S08879